METQATKKIKALKRRIRACQGGTAAGKTISILLILIDLAQSDKKPKLTSIVSESLPHLKRGVMRDFLDILRVHNYYKEDEWNRTDFIYTFPTGSQIEFFGADSPDKVRGPRRDRLFINEANNVPYGAFDQLEVRTREDVWLDWNPTNEFWFYTDVLPARGKDIDHVTLTYLDNDALEPSVIQAIEARKHNQSWWRVYGEGQLGEVEGRVYTDWQIIDEIPHEARLERRGMDFGYSNDPTTIVDIFYYNGGYIFNEQLYQKGMLNKQIADFLLTLPKPQTLVKADSAEPKSIDEIKSYGVNILPCNKGKGSVAQGIQYVQGQRCSITKRSTNIIKEYRNYMWRTDRDGRILNIPEKSYDHCMDAIRYGMEDVTGASNDIVEVQRTPLYGSIGY